MAHAQTLLLLNGALCLLLAAIFAALAIKIRRQKKAQERIVSWIGSPGSGLAGVPWYRVKFSRPDFHARIKWITGWEGMGVLVNAPDQVRLLGLLASGEQLDWRYPKNALALQWLGSQGLRSSNMHWFALGTGARQIMLTADTGLYAVPSRQNTADICRNIAPGFALPASAQAEFALEKNPATLTAMIVMLALVVFAFIDGILLNKYELLDEGSTLWALPALWALPVLCLAVLLLVYWLLSRPKRAVPWRESIIVALLVGVACGVAYLPALKRIDQYLAAEGAKPYAYRLGEDGLFTPVEQGPPEFHGRKRDWDAIKEGTTYDFLLLHGPLGLWQLDPASVDAKLQAAKKKEENATKRPMLGDRLKSRLEKDAAP